MDVIRRLEPVILEVERQQRPVLIVASNAVVRAMFEQLMGEAQDECSNTDTPIYIFFSS